MSNVKLRILGESVVELKDRAIAPDAPRLFALLLYLGLSGGRAVTKTELLDLLFPDVSNFGNASHNLRQLLYRMRTMGVSVERERDRYRMPKASVSSSLDEFALGSRNERCSIALSSPAILPKYEPDFSPQFAEWVESFRSQGTARLRGIVRNDFRAYQAACDWHRVVSCGGALDALNGSSEETVSGVAEALLMLGRKTDALDHLDTQIADCDSSAVMSLRHLRVRIAKTADRSSTLESPFFGRSATMRALVRQWTTAIAGASQLGIIVGPPGIGKSRMLREFCAHVLLHQGRDLFHKCQSSEQSRPLSLFEQILPKLRTARGSLGASPDLQKHLDRLGNISAPFPSIEPASLEATRTELQLAIIDLIDAVASENALLLVIDDAHYLDSASRSVIALLSAHGRHIPLMIVEACRTADTYLLSSHAPVAQLYYLEPLSSQDSHSVLRSLLPHRSADEAYLASCAVRAKGNPYYLHAIAQSADVGDPADCIPFDLRVYAASSYYALGENERTLFEVCLLLGRYATLRRVKAIAGIDGPPLLAALRALEHAGLLIYDDGDLTCAHGLLEEACRDLIPTVVAATLHERIAQCLETDCVAGEYAAPIAWAAADSWIASGNYDAACRLLEQCAAQAAALGEPFLAAQTLKHIPFASLRPQQRFDLLRMVVDFEEAASEREHLCDSLRALRQASEEVRCGPAVTQDITFRILEADLSLGIEPSAFIAPLSEVLAASSAPVPVRVRAGIRLLIAADMNLDSGLAASTIIHLEPALSHLDVDDPLRLRAELIHATVFGDQMRARVVATRLLTSHPVPALAQAAVGARRNAAFALSRMGLRHIAFPVLLDDYRFMAAHHVTSEATYSLLLLADNLLCDGDIEGARMRLREAAPLVRNLPTHRLLQAAYHSAASNVALLEGRLEEAEELVGASRERGAVVGLRYRAIDLSLKLKIRVARRRIYNEDSESLELRELYERGAHLGGQDTVVEAIWLVEGSHESTILRDYLFLRRREITPPEVSLRFSTRQDQCWARYDRERHTAIKKKAQPKAEPYQSS